jgi:hypothetical protein
VAGVTFSVNLEVSRNFKLSALFYHSVDGGQFVTVETVLFLLEKDVNVRLVIEFCHG